ncbi:hypothetical protein DFJ67_7368 [Asanoa ferruginea]|uniref:Uncharacterized protein n=1 Tax=Asanoa ferruginea TaxID=53367 RepID=A0A3D9ZVR8_9ACTN|nr:hypothetical protein [Asanoa ferruginea]REG01288.1 hypothetical protein DFJ67_7368 [Asanoa ferruginea]GIF51475.1 hypothetical protein Afe04nite_60140 [Asanoa ferruginea]
MKRTAMTTTGLVLAGLLGLGDVISIVGGVDGPPLAVLIAGSLLGVITLVGVVLGWRGSRAGIVTVVVTRLLSALTAVPAFFVDDVPDGAVGFAAVGVAVTLITVALLAPALRPTVRAGVA